MPIIIRHYGRRRGEVYKAVGDVGDDLVCAEVGVV